MTPAELLFKLVDINFEKQKIERVIARARNMRNKHKAQLILAQLNKEVWAINNKMKKLLLDAEN